MAQSTPALVYFNGSVVPYADAKVHVMAPALKYGAAVFEGLRAYWNAEQEQLYVFRLQDHCRRMLNSIKAMRMEAHYTLEELRQAVLCVLQANNFRQDLHIRHTVFVDGSGMVASTGPVGMAVVATPTGRAKLEGVNVCISSWQRIPDHAMPPRIKCVANYHNGRLAELQARADGYDVPLLLDTQGKVTEAPTATFFMVRDGVPITPPVSGSILESITRSTVIELFRELRGLQAQERPIDRTELYIADEAFLCGTAQELASIATVDRLPVGSGSPGPLTQFMQATYFDLARGVNPSHAEWRTAVYA